MDKVVLWLKQFSLNYPEDKFHRITILIELSLVERTQGPCSERCTSDTQPPLSLTPLAPCCVWWWRHNCLRKTFWDPANVMGVKMIDLTRWIKVSFMMTFTIGHIKLVNFEYGSVFSQRIPAIRNRYDQQKPNILWICMRCTWVHVICWNSYALLSYSYASIYFSDVIGWNSYTSIFHSYVSIFRPCAWLE